MGLRHSKINIKRNLKTTNLYPHFKELPKEKDELTYSKIASNTKCVMLKEASITPTPPNLFKPACKA